MASVTSQGYRQDTLLNWLMDRFSTKAARETREATVKDKLPPTRWAELWNLITTQISQYLYDMQQPKIHEPLEGSEGKT